jgi:hypothetical protein
LDAETATYMIIAAAGAVALGAYSFFILSPAWSAYGRNWERVAAAFLSLFVLAAFAGTGLATGLVIVYFWDELVGVFGAAGVAGGGAVGLLGTVAGAP